MAEGNDDEGVVYLLTNMLSKDTKLLIHNPTFDNRGSSAITLRPVIVGAAAIEWDASTGNRPVGLAEKNAYIVTVAGVVDGTMCNVGDIWVYPGASYVVPGSDGLLRSSKPKVDVVLSGEAHIINADSTWVVTLAGLVDMTDRFTVSIEDVRGSTGYYLVGSSAGNVAGCKVRMPRQTLQFSGLTPTGSQDLLPAAKGFRWGYPKKPCASASWWADGDAVILATQADVFCNVGALTTVVAQPYLRRSAAPWDAENLVHMAIEAWIDEL